MRQIATPPLMRPHEEPSGPRRGPARQHKGRRLKRYEVFPGRNKFYCDGRIIMAKQAHVFILTCVLIIGTCTLFFVFDCPYLFENIGRWIPAAAGALLIFVMLSLFRTSFSDPGIIPRATAEEAAHIEKQIEVPNGQTGTPLRPPPRTKEVTIHGETVKLKYCFTCKIFRPPRASHCSLCDNCVDRFDHHCPWVGNCVGRRNYRYFFTFIISLAALCIFIFSCVVTRLIYESRRNESLPDTLRENPASCVELIICFFSIWSILGLAAFHTYLTTANQTTNEDIKGMFSSRRGQHVRNPYSLGSCWANCGAVLCAPIPPSLIERRSFVDSGTKITAIRPFSTVSSKNGSQHSLVSQQVAAGGIPLSQLDRVERMVGGDGRGSNGGGQGSHRAISAPPATWNPHLSQPLRQFHHENRAGTLPQNLQGRSSGHNPVPVAVVPPHRTHGGSYLQGSNPQGIFRATPHIEGCPVNQANHAKITQARVLSASDYPASILKQSSV
ncbi:palmitoyltransferase ZDHHC18 [Galendromus occidentalis]|uniref:Palmitoyltransferase n=1 Tax=Galendromus occidentalis TaxID=34638 RepID=A0AAJ6QP15_9ACAR|nr:palmitoyltransferase ZDHHC18 [Galendromus occidentalis]